MSRIVVLVAILFFVHTNGKQIFVDSSSTVTNSSCGSTIDYACSTIQKALNNANNGDVISLSGETYSGSSNTQLTIPSGLSQIVISPVSVGTSVTIDFQHDPTSAPFLSINNMNSLIITSIDFINANTTNIFGVYNSTLVISDSTFTNNKVSSIIIADGVYVDIAIEDTLFDKNYGVSGSVINMQRNGKLHLNSVTFQSNYAMNGGAINTVSFVNITADNVVAIANTAGNQGGFLHATDGRTTFTNSIISSQFSDNSAGAVFLHGGRFFASNVQFLNNTAEGFGGAIHNDAASVQISNSDFSQNVGLLGGAAIYGAAGSGTTINQCIFSNNWASKGGAFGLFSSSRLTVTSSQMYDNEAEYGGAVYLFSISTISMINSTIQGNSATIYGGGIYCSDSTVNLTSSSLSQNTATLDDNTETGSSEDLFCSSSPPYTQCNVLGDEPWADQCQPAHTDNGNDSTAKGILITAILLPILGGMLCCGCVAVMFVQHRRGNKAPGRWIWRRLDSQPNNKDTDELPLGEEEN